MKNKIIIVGEPSYGLNEAINRVVGNNTNVEFMPINSLEQAYLKEQNEINNTFIIKPYTIDYPDLFIAPPTRSERRKQSRNKTNK